MTFGSSTRSTVRLGAVFVVMVLVGLVLDVARPQYQTHSGAWPGHDEPFTTPTFLPGDCEYYRGAIHSLLHDHDLDIHDDIDWDVTSPLGQISLGKHGEWYPKHPLGLVLAGLPFYALAGDDGLLVFNLLQVVALDLLAFLLARRYASAPVALAIGIAWAFGTLLRRAAYNFAPDVLSSLVVVAAVLALLDRRVILAGALLGASVAVKWTNLLFLPIAGLWLLVVLGFRPALRFALAAVPFLAALGALNWHMFGTPLLTPYDRVLGLGADGQLHLETSHRAFFDQPFFSSMWTQMVHPKLGLLRSAPLLLFAPVGFVLLGRRVRAEAILLAALCAAQILLFAPYREWQASNYGHRFLMTVVVLGAAPVAALLQRLWVMTGADSESSVPVAIP